MEAHRASANQLAADCRVAALAVTIRKLMATGYLSRRALADELNPRRIPTARGGSWLSTTVVRMLARLGLLTFGKGGRINNGRARKQGADARAKALASTIRAAPSLSFLTDQTESSLSASTRSLTSSDAASRMPSAGSRNSAVSQPATTGSPAISWPPSASSPLSCGGFYHSGP